MFAGFISPLVCGFQRVGNLYRQLQQAYRTESLPADEMFQGHTFKQLHDNEAATFTFTYVVHGADIGMVQG